MNVEQCHEILSILMQLAKNGTEQNEISKGFREAFMIGDATLTKFVVTKLVEMTKEDR